MGSKPQPTEVSVSRTIAASPEEVWALISNVTRIGEWSPETTSCSWLGGATGPAVGARFAGTNVNGKKRWKTTSTVVESEPGKSFVFDVKGGPLKVARWSYRITPNSSGCSVTETWTDQRGWLVTTLGKPISGVTDRSEHNRQGMEVTLANLAHIAETT